MTETTDAPDTTESSTPLLDEFQSLRQAVLVVAYDNGIINRFCPEKLYLEQVEELLGSDGIYYEDLKKENQVLASLHETEMETLCAGEHSDIELLVGTINVRYPDMKIGPDNLPVGEAIDGLLGDVFDLPIPEAAVIAQREAFKGFPDE